VKRAVAVSLLFVLLAGVLNGCLKKAGNGDNVATVNGHVITQADFDARRKIYELFFRQAIDNASSKNQLLDQMIREKLILDQAEKMGASVTDDQVEAERAKFAGALDRQYQSHDQVNQKLQEVGLTNEDIAGFLKGFLLAQAVVDKMKAEVKVGDEEVRTYYEQNKDSLYTFKEDVVRASHVLVPLDQEDKAQEVAAKAKAGGDFAELARLYSVDPGSSVRGGDLGYFTKDKMIKEFADAAFGMKPGEISDPVKSQYGWHIIKVVDQHGPGTLPFDLVKDDAGSRLLLGKQDTAMRGWEQALVSAAKVEKTSFTQ
jgi:foldase protein PrsA